MLVNYHLVVLKTCCTDTHYTGKLAVAIYANVNVLRLYIVLHFIIDECTIKTGYSHALQR